MSYLVLARKLRPAKFQGLIGQEHIGRTLRKAIKTDRVAHAFLFTGPRGTGKTSCARVLTKALNCISPLDHEPCNQCENCREITQGIATDVMEIDAASNRGIEHIRELRESVRFSPAKCTYKTYIIDEVHMLTTESFNALLKTLEEPPAHVKFILATTDHHKIPMTVISRCQRYDFTNIPPPAMVKYLKKVAHAESLHVSDSALYLIASHSAGGMRDALTVLDMLIGLGEKHIQDRDVVEVLGLNNAKEIDTLLTHIIEKDLASTLALFHDLTNKGRSLAQFITDLLKSVKDLTLVKSLPAEKIGWHEFLPDQLDGYRYLAPKTTNATLQQYFHILLDVEAQIRHSSQARICIEMGLIKMCSVESLVGVAEVISLLRGASPKSPPKTVLPVNQHIAAARQSPVPSVSSTFKDLKENPELSGRTISPESPDNTHSSKMVPPGHDFPVAETHPPEEGLRIPPAVSTSLADEREIYHNLEPPKSIPRQTERMAESCSTAAEQVRIVRSEAPPPKNEDFQILKSDPPFRLDDISRMWKGFLEELESRSHTSLLSLLRNSVVLEMSREKLVIGYTNTQVFNDEKKRTIANAARDFFKTPIKVYYSEHNHGLQDSLKVQKDKEIEQRKEAIKRRAANHPNVRKILKIFPNSEIKITIQEEL